MIRLILVAAVLFAVIVLMRHIEKQPPQQRKQTLMQLAIGAFVVLMIFAAATGRLHWLGAVLAGILPFVKRLAPLLLRLLPFFQIWKRRRQSKVSSGNSSTVATGLLQMQLDHDTGEMDGEVLEGPLRGKLLSQLDEQQLREFLDYCQSRDRESSQLLMAYLQRRFGDIWSEAGDQGRQHNAASGDMTPEEAWQILGLSEGATKEEIVQAHRKLMQKLHPDRGGNDYLAAKVNRAKSLLLDQTDSR